MIAGLYAIFIVISDQISKFIILNSLTPGETLPIVKSIFHLTLVFNKGGAFGILADATNFFIFISVAVIAAIAVFLFRNKPERPVSMALAFVMAGALSNLIDRLRFGYVVDFLDFRIWPVFNIADSAITIGTIWLVYKMIIKRKN